MVKKMINELKEEIKNLEDKIFNKRKELELLIEKQSLTIQQNKLIVVAELRDQFAVVTEAFLIDNDKKSIKETLDEYNNRAYAFEVKIFKSNDFEEQVKYLKEKLALESYVQDDLYEWIEDNECNLIDLKEFYN